VRALTLVFLAAGASACAAPRHVDPAPQPRWMTTLAAHSPSGLLDDEPPGTSPSASVPGDPRTSPTGASPRGSEAREPDGSGGIRGISLDEALDEALAGNIDLALARAEQEVAAARLEVSRGAFAPFLEVGTGYSRTQDRVQGSFGELRDVDFDSYEGATGLGWRFNLSATRHSIEAAEHEATSAAYESLDAERRLVLRVVELYETLVFAADLVQVTERLVADGEELLAIAQERERAGVGTAGDVTLAQTDLARTRQRAESAHERLETQSIRLANVLSTDPSVLLDPEGALLEPWNLLVRDPAVDPRVVLANRPDVTAARMALEAAIAHTEEAQANVWSPDIAVGLEQRYLGDSSRDIADGTTYGASLQWTFSVPGLRRVREHEAEERAARVRLVGRQQDVLAELREALVDVDRTESRLPLAREAVAAAEGHLEIQRERFAAGMALALEVVEAQGLHAESRAGLAASVVDHNLAQVRLLAAAGVLDRSAFSRDPTGDPDDKP